MTRGTNASKQARHAAMACRYTAGATMAEIAAELSASIAGVQYALRQQGVALISDEQRKVLRPDWVPNYSRRGHPTPLDSAYGRWTVLSRAGHFAMCRCACGAERKVDTAALRNGQSQSCGCLARERSSERDRTTHGMTKTGTYRSWQKMLGRCTNPKVECWKDYGGRGIQVCDRWLNSFENFVADMGERPDGMTLDRFPDMNGNYEPSNCRWATKKEQQRNTRRQHLVEAFGECKSLVEWVEDHRCTVRYAALRLRLVRGFNAEWAITEPTLPRMVHGIDPRSFAAQAQKSDKACEEFQRRSLEKKKARAAA